MSHSATIELRDAGKSGIRFRKRKREPLHDSKQILEVSVWLKKSKGRKEKESLRSIPKHAGDPLSDLRQSYVFVVIEKIQLKNTLERINIRFLESDDSFRIGSTKRQKRIDASKQPTSDLLDVFGTINEPCIFSSAARARNRFPFQNPKDVGDGFLGKLFGKVSERFFLRYHLLAIVALRQFSESVLRCPHVLHDIIDANKIALR